MTMGAMLDGQDPSVTKSVMTEPMGTTVSTTVVITVWMTLHVTNRLVTVTRDVTRDIQTITAATSVHLDNLDWIAENIVAAIV